MQDGNDITDRVDIGPAEDKVSGAREKGLNRGLEILQFLHTTQRAIGIGDLAKGVNAPRSTTYTLVRSLVDAGLLEMAGEGNRVYFGKKLYLYGMDYVRGNDLLRRGRQEVDELSRETGETSELCMLQSGRYTIVHSSPGTRPFRISSATGLQIPLPWTASGRLLLAGLEEHWSLEGLTTLVYGVPKVMLGLPPDVKPTPEIKTAQRSFFALLYHLLVGRDTGPRLPTLLLAVGQERVRALLGE